MRIVRSLASLAFYAVVALGYVVELGLLAHILADYLGVVR